MATYSDIVVNIGSGSVTGTGTAYTCPAGRNALCTVGFEADGAGTQEVTVAGQVVFVASGADTFIATQVFVASGDTIAASSSAGVTTLTVRAREFANP